MNVMMFSLKKLKKFDFKNKIYKRRESLKEIKKNKYNKNLNFINQTFSTKLITKYHNNN